MMDNRTFAAWLRPVVGLFALAGVLALSACGGGGGTPATNSNVPPASTGPGQNVLTVLPAAPVIYSQVPSALTITGGTAPYHAFSNNTTILPVVSTMTGNSLTLLAGPVAGTTSVTLTIQDSVGSTLQVFVTINPELVSSPPELIVLPTTLDAFTGIPTQVTVAGGVPPYRAFSSNSAILPVTQNVSGNAVPLLAAAVAVNTQVTITILDSVGQVAAAIVTVHPGSPSPPPALVVLPTSQDAFSGIATQLTVTGGVAPYRAFSTNTVVLPVTQNVAGNTIPLLAATVTANTLVTVTVQDAVGQTVSVPVTVHPAPVVPPPPLSALPTTLDAFSGVPTQITVIGGVAPYRAFSTNSAILPVTQNVVGNAVPLLAAAVAVNTPVTVTILDAAGQVATVVVTVRPGSASPPPALVVLPASLDIFAGIASQLTVSGGVAPYRAFSTNPTILPVAENVTGNAIPLLAAAVTANTIITVTVQDSVGQTVTVPVTVHPKPVVTPPALIALPTALDAYSGIPTQITVIGGVEPYRAFTTNSAVLPVNQNVTGNAVPLLAAMVAVNTPVTITILDAAGQVAAVVVTVHAGPASPPPALVVLPTSLDAFAGVATQLTVTGGVAPYRAFSTNPSVLPVMQDVVGNVVPLLAAAVAVNTPVTITILDSVGQVSSVVVTVRAGTVSPLVVLPASQDVFSGIASVLTVTGGVAPYRAFSTNSAILPVAESVTGNAVPLLAATVTANTTVTITVQDAVGQTVSVPVIVHPKPVIPPPALSALPTALDAYSGIPTQITVIGGVEPYRAFTTNAAVLPVTQSVIGNAVPLLAATVAVNTPVTVTILDAVGQVATVVVTVRAGPASPPPALVVFPASLDAFAGVPTQLTVTGGVAPYRAFSTNPGVLPVAQDVTGNVVPLLAATVAVNTPVTVTILDAVGQIATVAVTVHAGPSSPPPALVVLPATVDAFAGIPTQLTISGGVPPYRAFSTNSALLPVTQDVTGNTVPLLAGAVTANTLVTITIQDSVGQTATVPVTVHAQPAVPPPPLVVLPTTTDTYSGIATQLTVVGGVAPYRAFSTNSAVLPVGPAVTGNTLTLLAADVAATTTVLVTVIDSVGQTVVVTVTVRPRVATPAAPLVVLPADSVVIAGVSSRLTISGGLPPYKAFSTNPAILPVDMNVSGITVLLNANPVTIATAVIITIQDSVGQTVNATVSVRPSATTTPPPLVVLPADITVTKGVPFTLTISGGASPFFAYSSNPSVLPVDLNVPGNSLVLTANSVSVDTNVLVTVQDSAGQTVAVTVHVRADTANPPPTLTILPPTSIVFSGVPSTLLVSGGVPPYLAFTSNSAVLPVAQSVAGSVIPLFGVSVAADTTVTITVQDSVQKTATASVTVRPAPLLNSLTITPNLANCGTNAICSGQNGTAVVTVLLPGGGPAAGRQVRFDVLSGPYGIAQTESSATSPSQTVTSDSAGHAQVIIKANVDAPTQFAQIRATDVASGQQLIGNFVIVQSTDGTTILTVIPSTATITGAFQGFCSFGFRVDYFIYGGTPPYRITHAFPDAITLLNPTVNANGGFFEVVTNGGCVQPDTFSIVDATGRVTTATINNIQGTNPVPTPPVVVVPDLAVTPDDPPTQATCNPGLIFPFVVTGGTPPYNIFASPRLGTSPTITPSIVNFSGGETDISNVTQTIDVSFVDSTNPKKTLIRRITCTGSGPGGGSLLVTPSHATIPPPTCAGKTTNPFTITGGVAPYTVRPAFSQQATVAPPTVPASGGTFVVTTLQDTNTGGSALVFIVVIDSQGAQFVVDIACPQ